MKDCLLNNVAILSEVETLGLSLMGKREVHVIRADPLSVLVNRVQVTDVVLSLDETNPAHPVVDVVSVRATVSVVPFPRGQGVDRRVDAVVHREVATLTIADRNGASST